ncbi:hypothetical protein N9139_01080 [Akkermansiaceae bacterium]|nr:hypothetical protein [Akkermansiaceae bacterium]
MKNGLRVDWVILASAVLFFLMSRFIIPRYEDMLIAMGELEGRPLSTTALGVSIFLAVLFIIRLIWRFRKKS